MPERTLHLGVDFDDTLMPTREGLIAWLNAKHGTSVCPRTCTTHRLATLWNYTRDDFFAVFSENQPAFHRDPPFPGAQEALQELASRAHLHIITMRRQTWMASAAAWLAEHRISVDSLVCADDDPGGKPACAKRLNIQLFIEDDHESARLLADHGIPVLLLDKPYNRDCNHPRIRRVKDWHEIRQITSYL